MSRTDIIKYFKKLAEHSSFLQYAAESAERIGWALEVNLRDAAGRVILSLGSAPRECWSEAPPAVVAIDPDLFKRAGSDHPLRWGSLGQVDGHLIHRNDTSDGTGPARAARRERMAEAINRSMAGNKSYAVAAAAKAMAAGSGGDDFEVIAVDEITGELPPAFFGIDLGSKDGDVATYAAPSTDPVVTASLSVEAMEPVRPAGFGASVVEYKGLYTAIDGTPVWCWYCAGGDYFLGVWVNTKETFRMTAPAYDDNWTLVKAP